MGWKGAAIGGVAGWVFGGPLGALFGAALGSGIEKESAKVLGHDKASFSRKAGRAAGWASASQKRGLAFCASAAAMLAKMAKADGVVSPSEIAVIEQAFTRLGFGAGARAYAIDVFRRAKGDRHTIYEYAHEFAGVVSSTEVRELFYELLWDLACADGAVQAVELDMLSRMPAALGIDPRWFDIFAAERLRRGRASQGPRPDALAAAYATLGVSPSASAEEIRRAYREKAKKFHPDALKAQGLPDEMIGKATERMAKINAAWTKIKEARSL